MVKVALGALVMAAACASDPAAGGSVSGPIKGKTFAVADAITLARPDGVEIALTSSADQCVPSAQQVQHPYETALLILLADYDASTGHATAPVASGTYTINTGSTMLPHGATVEGNILDASCVNNADNAALASSGSVTLSGVANGTFSGTFDVLMDSGEHITGSFAAPTCAETKNPAPTCQP